MMESSKDPPLDEIQWRSPEAVQEMGGIHTNTVLHYFARSPFFDSTSNNATITTQAMYNQSLAYVLGTRALFEARLRSMQGLEFMVTHDPSEGDTKPVNSGIWVIGKQLRKKRAGQQDEITAISSYFMVGENIYMAPSLGNIIESRLLSIVNNLTELVQKSASLPVFTPARGYSYHQAQPDATAAALSTQATQSSSEAKMKPDTRDSNVDQTTNGRDMSALADDSALLDDGRLFAESWGLLMRYGQDYMDQNPIVGEPGNFKLSKSMDLALKQASRPSADTSQPFKAPPRKSAIRPTTTQTTRNKDDISPPTESKDFSALAYSGKKSRRKSKLGGVGTPKGSTPKPLPAD